MTPEDVFNRVFGSIPRLDPGSSAATPTVRWCIPACSNLLDIGCGFGAQTRDLAELTAVDTRRPFLDRSNAWSAEHGYAARAG